MRWVHFPLHPDTPLEGRSMAEFYAARGRDPHQMYLEMKARMDAEGLPYAERTHTYNSRMAQELGCWADTVPGGDALHDALFRAYFVERSNLAEESVLVALREELQGLEQDMQAFLAEAERDIREQRAEKMKPISDKLSETIRTVARKYAQAPAAMMTMSMRNIMGRAAGPPACA